MTDPLAFTVIRAWSDGARDWVDLPLADTNAPTASAAGWDAAARAAREHIAAEIEADRDAANWAATFRNGMDHAARIARGTP